MKKTTPKQSAKRLLNHYAAWKYVVLVTTIVILTLSAIPTWYGEQPSIQLQSQQTSSVLRNVPEL
ncbi:MAG: protein translocase subunit SecD, partial [Vibrio sp.]